MLCLFAKLCTHTRFGRLTTKTVNFETRLKGETIVDFITFAPLVYKNKSCETVDAI